MTASLFNGYLSRDTSSFSRGRMNSWEKNFKPLLRTVSLQSLTWVPAIHFLPPSPTFQCCCIEVLACELFGHMLKPECLPVSSDLSFFNDKTHFCRVWLWHSLMAADRHPRIFHLRKHDSFGALGHSILIHLFTLSCYLPCNIFCKSAYAFVDLGNIKLIKVYSVLTLYIKILLS